MSASASRKYQSEQAQYQAQVAQNNAKIQEQNATTAVLAGEEQALQTGQRDAGVLGAQRAGFAASGVDVNTGSAALVQQGEQRKATLDQFTVRNNAARQAYGYQVQGMNDTGQATLDMANAKMDQQAGQMQAFGSILSGVSSLGTQFAKLQQSGAFA